MASNSRLEKYLRLFLPNHRSDIRVESAILSATRLDDTVLISVDGKLCRGISARRSGLYRDLFRRGVLDRLIDKRLLVETALSDTRIAGFDTVVEHRRIPFVSYPNEWCPAMLRDAGLHLLHLQRELLREDLQLHDGHSWNIVFDGPEPRFVDLGSITTPVAGEVWAAAQEFARYFLHPLAVASAGFPREAMRLCGDYLNGVSEEFAAAICPDIVRAWRHRNFQNTEANTDGRLKLVDVLTEELSALQIPRRTTEWSEYYNGTPTGIDPSNAWRPKQHSFYSILTKVKPQSVVDVASNRGIYGQIAARLGARVAVIDRDEAAIADCYDDAVTHGLTLTPAIVDLLDPTPARGMNFAWFPSIQDRFHADLAMALALVHHLVFKYSLNFEQIAGALAGFAKKWLLIEFIPREDRFVSTWLTPDHDWYTQSNFLAALRVHFRNITVHDSDPAPRVFMLCER